MLFKGSVGARRAKAVYQARDHGGLGRYDAGLPGGGRAHTPAGPGEGGDAVEEGRRLAESKPRPEGTAAVRLV